MASAQSKTPNVEPFVCPFAILIDTREQLPFEFSTLRTDADKGKRPLRVETRRAYLPSGDYTIEGMGLEIAIERKSKDDLFRTIGQERDRHERKLDRLSECKYAAVVCEADWWTIFHDPPEYSELPFKSISRAVITWQVRYPRVQWWFCPGRAFAEAATFRLLERFWKDSRLSQEGKVTQ